MKPVISIIIPAYNAEKYIGRCLDAIIAQTFEDFEALVIENNSLDNTAEIIKQYAEKDSRIKYFNQPIQGSGMARNMGLDNATGKYLMFCDSDDWYDPKMCEKMLDAITEYNVDMAICPINIPFIKDLSDTLKDSMLKAYDHIGNQFLDEKSFALGTCSVWNAIFKKSHADKYKIRFPEYKIAEDGAFFYKMLLVSKTQFILSERLYNYDLSAEESTLHKYYPKYTYHHHHINVMRDCYDFLKNNHLMKKNNNREKFRAIGADFITTHISLMYEIDENIKPLTFDYMMKFIDKDLIDYLDLALLTYITKTEYYSEMYRRAVDFATLIKPEFDENYIPIAFLLQDNKNAELAAIRIKSMIENSDKKYNYDIMVFCDNIDREIEFKIRKLSWKLKDNVKLRVYMHPDFLPVAQRLMDIKEQIVYIQDSKIEINMKEFSEGYFKQGENE